VVEATRQGQSGGVMAVLDIVQEDSGGVRGEERKKTAAAGTIESLGALWPHGKTLPRHGNAVAVGSGCVDTWEKKSSARATLATL